MKSVKHFWKFAAIAFVFGVAGMSFQDWKIRQKLEKVYPYHIEVTAVNAESGEPIEQFGFILPENSKNDIFHQTSGIQSGIRNEIFGVAYEPREWIVISEGFEDTVLTVDRTTPPNLTIEIQPKARPTSQQSTHANKTVQETGTVP